MRKKNVVKRSIDWNVDQPNESPGYVLWRISATWQRRIRAALKPVGLTHAQFVLLTCLIWLQDRRGKRVTQADIAEQTGLDKVTTGDVLQTLEKAGLVTRTPHAKDKRAWQIAPTPRGRAKIAKAFPEVVAVDRDFFGRLEKDGRAFLTLMQRLDSATQHR
jgi:DNA-binding MarR family transcriptional regulator